MFETDVLPDGPTTRGAATSWRVYLFLQGRSVVVLLLVGKRSSRPTGGPMRLILPRPVCTPRSGRSTRSGPVRQDMGSGSLLAGGAEVGAATADDDALDGCAADAAG